MLYCHMWVFRANTTSCGARLICTTRGLIVSAVPSPRHASHQAADSRAQSGLTNLSFASAGLDARAAAIVMRTVRNIVNTGRTIVCTIHQPSIDIFESFDELLLLKRGGQTIYAGQFSFCSAQFVVLYLRNQL